MDYARDNIKKLHAYTPGEQPTSTLVVKLNTNENPYPPSEPVIEAIRHISAESLRRYPPPSARAFCEVAAKVHGVDPDQIIATNGGDELLRLMVSVYCDVSPTSGGGLGVAEPSYSLYPVLADIHDTRVTTVQLREDWSLPSDFADRLNDAGCSLAMIVSPHAPSGQQESLATLESIARRFKGVLLIDEAYVDFASVDALSLLDKSRGLDNVILLRSLSKGYSLAGLRFGYGIGSPAIIAALHKAKDSYNTDAVSQAAAIASLQNRNLAARNWRLVIDERQRLSRELAQRGFHVFASQSNFVLVVPPPLGAQARQFGSAKSIYESLKKQNILVRYFDLDRLRDKLRITIGTPKQNDALLTALDQIAAVAVA
jgi:histidinol-phosphate aminotransferase